jgi:hypothetical protein
MTIRDMKRFTDALWDWGFLDGCFGTSRSRVGDIDGIVEHCGEILLLEGKPMRLAPAAGSTWQDERSKYNGQARLWSGLAGRGITVLILWGDASDQNKPNDKTPSRMQVWRRFKPEPDPVIECDKESVRKYVASWWNWTEQADAPKAK